MNIGNYITMQEKANTIIFCIACEDCKILFHHPSVAKNTLCPICKKEMYPRNMISTYLFELGVTPSYKMGNYIIVELSRLNAEQLSDILKRRM